MANPKRKLIKKIIEKVKDKYKPVTPDINKLDEYLEESAKKSNPTGVNQKGILKKWHNTRFWDKMFNKGRGGRILKQYD